MTTMGTGANIRTPQGFKVAPMSYAKLEEVAHGVRPLLPKTTTGNSEKIDAWRMLEKTLQSAGYNYHVEATEELEECAAFTIPERQLIVLRQDVYEGLFTDDVFSRSTVIHEFSHIVLKHSVTLHRGSPVGNHQFYEDSEWQAKALTAAVMMPISTCQRVESAHELAYVCGTSVQAAGYRLDRLVKEGLIPERRTGRGLFDQMP